MKVIQSLERHIINIFYATQNLIICPRLNERSPPRFLAAGVHHSVLIPPDQAPTLTKCIKNFFYFFPWTTKKENKNIIYS